MRIFVLAKPGAKIDSVLPLDKTHLRVSTKTRPENGKANISVVRLVASFFGISPSRLKIISGVSSRQKIIELK